MIKSTLKHINPNHKNELNKTLMVKYPNHGKVDNGINSKNRGQNLIKKID